MEEEYLKLMNALAGREDLDPAIKDFLKMAVERKVYTGTQTLQENGIVSGDINFIIEGIARLYYSHTDDRMQRHKITSAFIQEGDFAFTLHSFFTQVPSLQSIELIGAGKIFAINYQTIREATARFLDMTAILEKIKDRYYEQLKERSYILGLPLVRDRYHYLAAHKSWLFQRVPMEYIATYIGTTRENLTRIRSRYGGPM